MTPKIGHRRQVTEFEPRRGIMRWPGAERSAAPGIRIKIEFQPCMGETNLRYHPPNGEPSTGQGAHRHDLAAGGSRHHAIVVVKVGDLPETISAHGYIKSVSVVC